MPNVPQIYREQGERVDWNNCMEWARQVTGEEFKGMLHYYDLSISARVWRGIPELLARLAVEWYQGERNVSIGFTSRAWG